MNKEYWIWLSKIIGYGSIKLLPLIEIFGSAEGVYDSSKSERIASGIWTKSLQTKSENTSLADCKNVLKQCDALGINVLCYGEKGYPEILKNIPDPPVVLYYKGQMPDFDNTPAFCIVGPRKCSDFAKKSAFSLGYRLSKGGITVVSGGALGADFYAHAGAIKADGVTVCVMPCGLDIDYPVTNQPLRNKILQKGCLISEFEPGTKAFKGVFGIRNRLLSGLCLGMCVVEASEKSGTMLTVASALEQGRDVFAVPHKSSSQFDNSGVLKLLSDGARPLLSALDIFKLYYSAFPDKIDMRRAYNVSKQNMYEDFEECSENENKPRKRDEKTENNSVVNTDIINKTQPKKDLSVLSDNAKIIFGVFGDKELTVDEIYSPSVPDSQVFAALSELELFGFITALPGGRFAKNN